MQIYNKIGNMTVPYWKLLNRLIEYTYAGTFMLFVHCYRIDDYYYLFITIIITLHCIYYSSLYLCHLGVGKY